MILNITKWLKYRICVLISYFVSIKQTLSATCPVGDTVLVFGCEIDLYSFQNLRR